MLPVLSLVSILVSCAMDHMATLDGCYAFWITDGFRHAGLLAARLERARRGWERRGHAWCSKKRHEQRQDAQ